MSTTTSYAGRAHADSDRRREAVRNRTRLLTAARHVVATHGEHAEVREIAGTAGVAAPDHQRPGQPGTRRREPATRGKPRGRQPATDRIGPDRRDDLRARSEAWQHQLDLVLTGLHTTLSETDPHAEAAIMLTPDGHLAIRRVVADYGHIVDEHDWDRADEVLTPDVVFETGAGGTVLHGITEIVATCKGLYAHLI